MSIVDTLKSIDWHLLRQQKYDLFELEEFIPSELLDGLLGFIEAIQDAAVTDGIVTEVEMFGTQDNEYTST